jgi:anti-sigma factor RsiW
MSVLTCYLERRRIGAFLDGALPDATARGLIRHLDGCAACRAEAATMERLRSLVREAAVPADPDWTGFWPAVARGIEAGQPGRAAPARAAAGTRRVALAGALAAALVAVAVWNSGDSPTVAPHLGGVDNVSVVNTADTEHPGGSVMVYSPPTGDMTVIWVFGLDNPGPSTI